jgi:hypothetical protein
MTKRVAITLLGFWAVWVVSLTAVAMVADTFLPYAPQFPYAKELLASSNLPRWAYSWGGFDGVHYLTIMEKGYIGTGLIQAFFPVYPLLSEGFGDLTGIQRLSSGLLISLLASAGLVLLLWHWAKYMTNERVAYWAVGSLLLFPTAFFLRAFYSESVFLCLCLGSLLCLTQKSYTWAAVLAGIASGTRIVGVGLAPALLLGWYVDQKISLPKLAKKVPQLALWGALSISGLVSFMYYLWQEFGDPLFFLHVQNEFGSGRSESLVFFPQVWWRALKIVLTYQAYDARFFTYFQEFFLTTFIILLLVWGWWRVRKVHKWWPSFLFASIALLLPTLTGTFSSMSRYALAAFPVLVFWAEESEGHPWWRVSCLIGSGLLLLINTILFIQGYWVA